MFFFRLPQSEHNKKCYAELKWAVFKLSTKKKDLNDILKKKTSEIMYLPQNC